MVKYTDISLLIIENKGIEALMRGLWDDIVDNKGLQVDPFGFSWAGSNILRCKY